MTLEKDLAIFQSNLRSAQNLLGHAKMMSSRGYVSGLELEEKKFAVTQANLNLKLKRTEIEVLTNFTQLEELAKLEGDLKSAKAQYEADRERAYADEQRRKRAEEERGYCVMKAERGGMVIHPSAAAWMREPLAEGSTVHKDQVLLLMPDLSKMQVKVGIHESIVDRVKPGALAKITLPGRTIDGEVSSVAEVTRPAGWWTGNVVKYDTIITLPSVIGLKPGMTAEVEVIMAQHESVLMIPVTAVVETEDGDFCWVKTADELSRRELQLGDNNDMFIVVQEGLEAGDEVVLDPLASVEEAQTVASKTLDEKKQ
jgi:multidrug efflux pump subunit AcrA (membrane-fusion protein)